MTSKLSAARAVADLGEGSILAVVEIEAPRERVFEALTTAEVAKWWGSDDWYHVTRFEADLRPGGAWKSVGVSHDGRDFTVGGKVLEVDPPRLFAHTWEAPWDGGNVTTVRYQLDSIPGGTRVTLRHTGFAGRAEACRGHTHGWERVLSWLSSNFAGKRQPKVVVRYHVTPESLKTAMQHYPAHKARLDAFHARGELLWVGRFEDPLDGAMAIFSSRAAADAFVKEDPFVLNGVVTRTTIRGWDEIYA